MCGIVGGFSDKADIKSGLKAAHHRGPDNQGLTHVTKKITLGHTRLSIIDTSSKSNQPFRSGKTTITYNGELWNYKELREELVSLGNKFSTKGDVEVIAKALDTWGDEALTKFDGMFSIIWHRVGVLKAARDMFGEVPLYYSPSSSSAASEIKILKAMGLHDATLLEPGCMIELSNRNVITRFAKLEIKRYKKYRAKDLDRYLTEGIIKKTISDVPVCCLLSGGIDSSIILKKLVKVIPDIKAYTAVFNERSRDLAYARQLAAELNVELIEVPIPEPSIEDLKEVVRHIEIPYKAQVEIGWACLNLAKQIQKDGYKVVFSGEGADELFGSYGFAYHAIAAGEDWSEYRLKLFQDQHKKNFLRCNKIFMSHSIECRLPFLHKPLVEYILSLPLEVTGRDKTPLKEVSRGELPEEIIKRPKVAFQDGLGLKKCINDKFPSSRKLYMDIFRGLYGIKKLGLNL